MYASSILLEHALIIFSVISGQEETLLTLSDNVLEGLY